MKYRSEEHHPFLFEGGDDAGGAPADNEAAPAGDKKEEISDEEAMKRAIERNKKLIAAAKAKATVEHKAEHNADEYNPDSIERSTQGPLKKKLCCDFWLNGILWGLIVLISDIYRVKTEPCGIDVIFWCEIFFALLLAKTILVFFLYFAVSSCSGSCIGKYYLTVSIFMGILFFGWVVYGSVLYFSDDNDCQSNHEIFGWLVLMVVIIFFFYFFILLLLFLLCGLACFICCVGKEKADKSKDFVDRYLTKQIYDPEQFNHTDTCAICGEKFKSDDEITPLPCNPKHYFHSACIEKNIEVYHNFNCPICRQPIDSPEAALIEEKWGWAGENNDAQPGGDDKPPAEDDKPAE